MTHHIRTLTADEVEIAISWAAREGWNPGTGDAAAFLAQDPDGFIGLFEAGELASVISAVTYGPAFGFIGFYICRPDMRGQGYGRAVWYSALERLGSRVVGLDGVLDQVDNYARSGFVLAHRNIRYGGLPHAPAAPHPDIKALDALLVPAVMAFDRRHFLFDRPGFLSRWLLPTEGRAFAAHKDGGIAGYCVVRRCGSGHKIGPLFAPDAATARALYGAACGHAHAAAPGEPIFLDVPEPHAAAREMAQEAGLTPVFETARMYRGAAPALPLDRIFGITTFELG
ncbi:GNAT family N-acetyltransferase [Aquabacter sp. L1I39]|uniref:GNAT family N-acetyltransferase n=1 Tax=Aquabacter sp. L1I39 TaxID=2820278 RepID=UPI001ADA7D0C|nr:GNAT family N-acetyltransferase [Aquabacter sp. L1I39]QTL03865.1 GNAT family N-acetyltransferase [Aquabacter sp. L1I39]